VTNGYKPLVRKEMKGKESQGAGTYVDPERAG